MRPVGRAVRIGLTLGLAAATLAGFVISAVLPWSQTPWAHATVYGAVAVAPAAALFWLAWHRVCAPDRAVAQWALPVWATAWAAGAAGALLLRPEAGFRSLTPGSGGSGTGIGRGWLWALLALALGLLTLIALAVSPKRATQPAADKPASWPSTIVGIIAGLTGLVTALLLIAVDAIAVNLIGRDVNDHTARGSGQPGELHRSRLLGGTAWTHSIIGGRPSAFIATASGPVMVLGAEVMLLDPATGEPVWRYQRSAQQYSPKVSADNSGERVLIHYDGQSPIVVAADSGRRVGTWPQSLRNGTVGFNPPIATKNENQGVGTVLALDTKGVPRWTRSAESTASIDTLASEDVVIANERATNGGRLVAYEAQSGEQLWSQAGPTMLVALTATNVVTTTGDPTSSQISMRALDLRTGEQQWATKVCRHPKASGAFAFTRCGTSPVKAAIYSLADGQQVLATELQSAAAASSVTTPDGRIVTVSGKDQHCTVTVIDRDARRVLREPRWERESAKVPCGRAWVVEEQVLISAHTYTTGNGETKAASATEPRDGYRHRELRLMALK